MKILLIDDRIERQVKFTNESGINLNDYRDILDNYTGEKYEQLLSEFRNGNYNLISDYEVIITHRSAYEEINGKVLDKFKELCKNENKKLVFFSGGISSVAYLVEPFEFLLLNSEVLYSKNIEIFLDSIETSELNILLLAYGKNWNLNILLNTLEKINMFIGQNEKKEMVSYNIFKKETGLAALENMLVYTKPSLQNGGVEMKDLKELSKEITDQIKQQVVLNV